MTDLTDVMRTYDVGAVVNCAGTTQPDDASMLTQNVGITQKLIVATCGSGRRTVFCQIGSAAEYQMLSYPQRTDESCPTIPQGAYGKSKLAASMRVLEATRTGEIAGYVLRLFNPLGSGMPESQLMGRILSFLQGDSRDALSLGNLDSYRDFVDIRDVVRAVTLSIERAEALTGEVLNIGSGKATQTRALVDQIILASGRSFVEDSGQGSTRSHWARWQEADVAKAKQFLGWEPTHSLRETVMHFFVAPFRVDPLFRQGQ